MNQITFPEVVRLVSAVAAFADRLGMSFAAAVDRFERLPQAVGSHAAAQDQCPRAVAQALLRARARRREILGIDLFRDPAWDILLDLYGNAGHGGSLMISALCHSACVPPTTALRYVHRLVKAGVLVSEDHAYDQRRTMVRLAPEMPERIEHILTILRNS